MTTSASAPTTQSPWTITLQELSIKMIDCARLERDYRAYKNLTKEDAAPDLTVLANYIIEKYNSETQKPDESPIFKPLNIPLARWQQINTKQFSILAFYSSPPIGNAVARMFKELGNPELEVKELSYLFLLYRVHEKANQMFALSCGSRGYKPVQPYADYTFPRKIALRILNPKEISKESSKRILGSVLSSTELLRSNILFDPNSLQKIYTEFQTSLRANASIYQIPHFQNVGGKIPEKTAEVEIREGVVRFHKQLPFEAYPLILDHFATIAAGKKTYLYFNPSTGQRKLEKDAKEEFAFLDYFTPVALQRHVVLEKQLLQELASAFKSGILLDWTLTHPHFNDYFKAHEFRIRYVKSSGSPIIYEWQNERKTVNGILKLLREGFPHLNLEIKPLAVELEKIYIDFKIGSDWKLASFSDCIIGQVRVEIEGKPYTFFKLNQRWYEISSNLLSRVDTEFRKLLIDCLIEEGKEGFLPHRWQSKPQNLTYESIEKALKMEKGKAKAALEAEVSFLDSQGNTLHANLEGDILSHPVIYHFRDKIKPLLLKPQILLQDLVDALGQANFARAAFEELKKKRPIAQTKEITEQNKTKLIVIIKNPFPPKGNPLLDHKTQLKTWAVIEDYTMHEGPYNEGYLYTKNNDNKPYSLEDSGWLVGDRIEVKGIELFDVAYYTKENIYLYHVKRSFDSARDALSQVMNAARVLSTSGNQRDEFLSGFYDEVLKKPKKSDKNYDYFNAARTQFLSWGEDGKKKFLELFHKRKIIFVYALADDRAGDHIITEAGLKKDVFTEQDFTQKETKDFTQEKTKEVAKQIFEFLKKEDFLSAEGKKQVRCVELHDEETLKFEGDLLPHRKFAWQILTGDIGHYRSLIGRMDLLHTRAQVDGLEFGFKVCQIRPPGDGITVKVEEQKSVSWKELDDAVLTQMMQQTQVELLFYRVQGWFDGAESWVKQKTVADGSCAFHALFGVQVDGEYRGDVQQMRKGCADKLRACLNPAEDRFADDTLQNLYEMNLSSMIKEAQMGDLDLSNASYHLRNSAKMLFRKNNNNLKSYDEYLSSVAYKNLKLASDSILSQATEKNNLTKILKNSTKGDEDDFFKKLSTDKIWASQRIVESIKELGELVKTPTYKELAADVKKVENGIEETKKLQKALLLNNPEIMENFLACIENPEYWLSDDELQMIAHVNDIRVEIMRQDGGDDFGCNNQQFLKPRAEDQRNLVVIHATKTHFSRCLRYQG